MPNDYVLPGDIAELPRLHAALAQRVAILERDMEEIKADLKDFRSETKVSLEKLDVSLTSVVLGALNSMPQWAAQSLGNSKALIGVLTGVCASLAGVVLALLHH